MTHQFSGLIKCLNCGKNFKVKTQKGKLLYVCSGMANYGKEFCAYFEVSEEDLIYTASKHLAIAGKRVEEDVSNYVKKIEVKGKGYTIYYVDGSKSIINSTDNYGIMVQY